MGFVVFLMQIYYNAKLTSAALSLLDQVQNYWWRKARFDWCDFHSFFVYIFDSTFSGAAKTAQVKYERASRAAYLRVYYKGDKWKKPNKREETDLFDPLVLCPELWLFSIHAIH